VIVAGDFNSPSHLDWRLDTATRHRGLVVDWPVSLFMQQAGFVDAYRTIHADAMAAPGFTWSPRFEDAWKDRIDFIYTHGEMTPLTAAVVDLHPPRWPSDHGAVSATLRLY
jgi:endonuclease/exonuclease/phosphatase family metal-dependent hydrolase